MACNSDKCHCPACKLEKLENRVGVLELRESNRDMMTGLDRADRWQRSQFSYSEAVRKRQAHRDNFTRRYPQAVYVAGADVIKVGRDGFIYEGYGGNSKLVWRWTEGRGHRWRKFDIARGVHFGMVWQGDGTRTPDGNLIFEYGGEGRIGSSVEVSMTKRVGQIEKTDRVIFTSNPGDDTYFRDAFRYHGGTTGRWRPMPGAQKAFFEDARVVPDWAESVAIRKPEGKVEYAMTPFMIEVMLHAFYSCESFRSMGAPAYPEAVHKLITLGLIEATTDAEQRSMPRWRIKATEKGRVYVEALKAVPMPVPVQPVWRMP